MDAKVAQPLNSPKIFSETVTYDEIHQIFARRFKENYTKIHHEIKNALNEGDIKLAHRLVHNLKSNAGQLRKSSLQQAAREVEDNLKSGENHVTDQQMQILERELNSVIVELSSEHS